jgi:tetratricopeptide (TPR) repeat protein
MTFLIRLLFVALPAVLLAITPLRTLAGGGWPKNEKELAILPAYCKDTQIIIDVSKLTEAQKRAQYAARLAEYGVIYHHMHHYCLGLLQEFNEDMKPNKGPKQARYRYALANVDYVLNYNPPSSFSLLPEIYTSRGRILLKQGKTGNAVADLMKAIDLKPDYEPAYIQLSELYLSIGQKEKAISFLEKGVENNLSPSRLLRRLERLGKPYSGTPGSAVVKPESNAVVPNDISSAKASASPPGADDKAQDIPAAIISDPAPSNSGNQQQPAPDSAAKPTPDPSNPYCRFCP